MPHEIDTKKALQDTDFRESDLLELSISAVRVILIVSPDVTGWQTHKASDGFRKQLKFEFFGKYGGLEGISATVARNSCPPLHTEQPYDAGLGPIRDWDITPLEETVPRYQLRCEWAGGSLEAIYEEYAVTELFDADIIDFTPINRV